MKKLLEEYAHKRGQSLAMYLSMQRRQHETVGECIERVYAQVERFESRR